jgi:hypothetical protein
VTCEFAGGGPFSVEVEERPPPTALCADRRSQFVCVDGSASPVSGGKPSASPTFNLPAAATPVWTGRARFVVRSLVATFSSVTRQHVLQALAEYDARGGEEFLEVYGFGPSRGHTLIHEGRSYDSRAILGVAHRFATGRLATSDEFSGGMQGAVAILRKRGFEVSKPDDRANARDSTACSADT